MSDDAGSSDVRAAVDNDVVKKTVCYGIVSLLWPLDDKKEQIGVLGAARYVVRSAIERFALRGDTAAALTRLDDLLDVSVALEPTMSEVEFASEMELFAQRSGLQLDTGESQLAAMTIERGIAILLTGDKRAIAALERMLDGLDAVKALVGRVQCLEQIVLGLITTDAQHKVAEAICSEPNVDTALTICFGCLSGGAAIDVVLEGLCSYIGAARRTAPRLLAPSHG